MLKVGIVGLPNVGKSTLFNAVTKSRKAQAANYPFCTIEPNTGIVTVPDFRLERLGKISSSEKVIPAVIEMVDIAGLVEGASKGEGLGNQFLSHVREVDAIVQVVRCFEDDNIHHVSGSIDPLRDIGVILTELVLADMVSIQKQKDRAAKLARSGNKQAKAQEALLERLCNHLDQGEPAITIDATEDEMEMIREFFLLTSKPTLFACNVAESDLSQLSNKERSSEVGRRVAGVESYCSEYLQAESVIISAQIEEELLDLSEEDRQEYLKGLGVGESGVGSLIRGAYHLLGLRTYLTTGEKETRAWTIYKGDRAPQAAGVIHTDFERGFIAAETIAYHDLIELGSFAKAKEAGKLRIEGKDYVVKDGDVMEFRFNI
ncbi:MAG: redox-regulated ATPase YchF [Verrucomicrobiota bacterium]